jgi:uncharacterized protein YjbI with pentapeptide repeats
MIGRRRLLAAAFGALATPSSPVIGHGRRRVTQGELDDAIAQHRRWLEDRTVGRRADFTSCNLAGLDFGFDHPDQVVLRNADFTDADLSGIRGNDVNFHHGSLQYANLSGSHLKAPVFSNAVLTGADCRRVVWGWPSTRGPLVPGYQMQPPEHAAVLMTAMLSKAIFDRGRIRGYFYDCSLTAASLVATDLSQSQFAGSSGANRFGMAKLIETRFRYTQIAEAAFKKAVISRADFLGARLDPQIARDLKVRDTINVSDQTGLSVVDP